MLARVVRRGLLLPQRGFHWLLGSVRAWGERDRRVAERKPLPRLQLPIRVRTRRGGSDRCVAPWAPVPPLRVQQLRLAPVRPRASRRVPLRAFRDLRGRHGQPDVHRNERDLGGERGSYIEGHERQGVAGQPSRRSRISSGPSAWHPRRARLASACRWESARAFGEAPRSASPISFIDASTVLFRVAAPYVGSTSGSRRSISSR